MRAVEKACVNTGYIVSVISYTCAFSCYNKLRYLLWDRRILEAKYCVNFKYNRLLNWLGPKAMDTGGHESTW